LDKQATSGPVALGATGDMTTTGFYTACYQSATPAWVLQGTSSALMIAGANATGNVILGNSNNQSVSSTKLVASNSTGCFTTVGNIASLANCGVPSETGSVNASLSAAVTATTLYTPAATGLFRITASLQLTTAATTSSILGGTTGIVITYTDGTSSVAQTVTCYAFNQSATIITISTGNTGNTTTSQYNCIPMYIYAKTGVAIQYAIGYTSVGGTAMVYQAHLLAEAM
jgi:hypothetical protein